jgi:hypothetical protein
MQDIKAANSRSGLRRFNLADKERRRRLCRAVLQQIKCDRTAKATIPALSGFSLTALGTTFKRTCA